MRLYCHIPWSVLNSGGTNMASTGYKAMVSTAQSVIGESQSTNYQMKIGYWYGGKPFMCGDANGSGNVEISSTWWVIYLKAVRSQTRSTVEMRTVTAL